MSRSKPPNESDKLEHAKIEKLDISLGRICNLHCIMCNDYYSNQINGTKAKELPLYPVELGYFKSSSFMSLAKSLKEVLIQGGEPFLSPLHPELLHALIGTGRADEISLNYITNGTVIPSNKIIELWKQFAHVQVEISLDHIEEKAEFIRMPMKWKHFVEVFHSFDQLAADIKIELNIKMTLGLLNAFAIGPVLTFLEKFNHVSQIPSIGFIRHPNCLSLFSLPLVSKIRVGNHFKEVSQGFNCESLANVINEAADLLMNSRTQILNHDEYFHEFELMAYFKKRMAEHSKNPYMLFKEEIDLIKEENQTK